MWSWVRLAASLQFDRIGFTYPGEKSFAINNVSINVKPSELVVLVGPSGCGKSTLLRIVAGLIIPDSGRLYVDGEDTVKLPPEKRCIGWVPQNYALFEHLNVTDNVGFGLRMQGVSWPERDRQVEEMLNLCRIREFAKRSVRSLSGGQRQRVAIARALAVHPRVLLLDEPLAALDPQLRTAIRSDLKQLLRESGVTSLFVTHDQHEALAIADKVIVLRSGKIEQVGTPEELWNFPANEFVAEFLNSAIVTVGTAIDECTVEFDDGLCCRTNRNVTSGQNVTLAMRKENFEISSDGFGLKAHVLSCEYSGGIYQIKVRTEKGTLLPVTSSEKLAVGSIVLVNTKKNTEMAVVGAYERSVEDNWLQGWIPSTRQPRIRVSIEDS